MQSRRNAAAYEIKFLVDTAIAREIIAHVDGFLSPDPHGASSPSETKGVGEVAGPTAIDQRNLRGVYRITTIYTDTQGWDVYYRNGRFAHVKFRVRTYDGGPWAYLERKSKTGARVHKTREAIAADQLSVTWPNPSRPEGVGAWFFRGVHRYALAPVCRVSYFRQAFVGASRDGPLRATFDRQVVGGPCSGGSLDDSRQVPLFASDKVICEFKFCGTMPTLFKDAIAQWKLSARGISKYRRCVETLLLNSAREQDESCPNG